MSKRKERSTLEHIPEYTIQTLLSMDCETMCDELGISQEDILSAFHTKVALYDRQNAMQDIYYTDLLLDQVEEEQYRVYRKGVNEDEWNE